MTSLPCLYTTRSGNPCRYLAISGTSFCERHNRQAALKDVRSTTAADLGSELALFAGNLKSPKDLNYILAKIFRALAMDHISTRKAAVLGYLLQMSLRTHHEIFRRDQIQAELDREEELANEPMLSRNVPRPVRDPLP